MELRDLRTFLAVARRLSFHKAGEDVHAAQSTVSARIAALEADLGVRLFERLGRRVALTQSGQRLLDYAGKMADLEDEARALMAGESELRGSLTVRVPESLCAWRMGPLVRGFRERFPQVALSFTACTNEGLEKDLRQGVTDLAFLMADSVSGNDLAVELLGVERLGLVAAPGHPLAARKGIGPQDLEGETLVLSKADCSYRRMLEGLLDEAGVRRGAGVEFSSAAALRGCVLGGLGVSVLPLVAVADEVAAGRLAVLDWAGPVLETGVLMIRHRDKWLSPPLAAFVELARAGLMPGDGSAAPRALQPLKPGAGPAGRCC